MYSDLVRRTGIYSEPTPEKCAHYARLLKPISRQHADAIYFGCFATVIVLLIISSGMYTRSQQTLSAPELELESRSRRLSTTHSRIRVYCLCVSILCFFGAVPCIVFEALAAFHIQFCDGEDLMMLYWAFWTLLQCGSLVAILGVSLNQWYGIKNRTQPPWAVALGTPVLIVAALAHAGGSVIKDWRQKHREAKSVRSDNSSTRGRSLSGTSTPLPTSGVPFSRATTVSPPAVPSGARFVGWTLEKEPLFAFPPDTNLLPMDFSRRQSSISPLTTTSTMATPQMSHSPERDVKFFDEV